MHNNEEKNSDDDEIPSKAHDLQEMQTEELSGAKDFDSLEVSETDEDEDEGTGDGNIGRTLDDPLNS